MKQKDLIVDAKSIKTKKNLFLIALANNNRIKKGDYVKFLGDDNLYKVIDKDHKYILITEDGITSWNDKSFIETTYRLLK